MSARQKSEDEYIGNSSPLARKVLNWFGIKSARQERMDREESNIH